MLEKIYPKTEQISSFQGELNFKASREAKLEGQQQAEDNANYCRETWSDEALNYVRKFIRTVKRKNFMMEDISSYAHTLGLPKPPSNRVWGSIAAKAQRRGLIKKVGIAPVKRIKAKNAYATVYDAV